MTARTVTELPDAPVERRGRGWPWPVLYAGYALVLALLYLRHNRLFALDDSFITYRYAQNLAEGHGLVFNVGERFFGTTAAGYAVLLAGMHLLTGVAVPQLSIAASAAGLTAVAAGLPSLARRVPGPRRWLLSAVVATAAFVLHPANQIAGHETLAFLGVAFLGTLCVTHWSRPGLGGVLVALAVTLRPDVLLLAVLTGLAVQVVEGGRTAGLLGSSALRRFALGCMVPLVAWAAFLRIWFGTIVPGTLDAKRAQVGLGYWPIYGPGTIWGYLTTVLGATALALLLAGWVAAVLRPGRPAAAQVMVWLGFGTGAAVVYTVAGVTFWPWYGTPLLFALLVVAFVGWANLAALRWGWAPVAVLAGGLAFGAPAARSFVQTVHLNPHVRAYEQVSAYIREHSPDGATILMPEPGSFGYHLGPAYTVIDELGLVSPGVATALLAGDTSWAFRTYRPDYLICSWHGRYTACDQGLQKAGYTKVGTFDAWYWERYLGRGDRLFVRAGAD